MEKQDLERLIENQRKQITDTRKMISEQRSLALCLLSIARNEEEIRVQQEILMRLCKSEIKLNDVEKQLNVLEVRLILL